MEIKRDMQQGGLRCENCRINYGEFRINFSLERNNGRSTWGFSLCAGCLSMLQGMKLPEKPKPRFEARPSEFRIPAACHPEYQNYLVWDTVRNFPSAVEVCESCATAVAKVLNGVR